MTSSSLHQPKSGLSGPQAYSDDGRRRKQSGSRRDPVAASPCKRRANCLKPKGNPQAAARSPAGAPFDLQAAANYLKVKTTR
jgi:hypothetical protein